MICRDATFRVSTFTEIMKMIYLSKLFRVLLQIIHLYFDETNKIFLMRMQLEISIN